MVLLIIKSSFFPSFQHFQIISTFSIIKNIINFLLQQQWLFYPSISRFCLASARFPPSANFAVHFSSFFYSFSSYSFFFIITPSDHNFFPPINPFCLIFVRPPPTKSSAYFESKPGGTPPICLPPGSGRTIYFHPLRKRHFTNPPFRALPDHGPRQSRGVCFWLPSGQTNGHGRRSTIGLEAGHKRWNLRPKRDQKTRL